jgi:hypothetical protein
MVSILRRAPRQAPIEQGDLEAKNLALYFDSKT